MPVRDSDGSDLEDTAGSGPVSWLGKFQHRFWAVGGAQGMKPPVMLQSGAHRTTCACSPGAQTCHWATLEQVHLKESIFGIFSGTREMSWSCWLWGGRGSCASGRGTSRGHCGCRSWRGRGRSGCPGSGLYLLPECRWWCEVMGWRCTVLLTLSLNPFSPRPSPEQDLGGGADGQPPAVPRGPLHGRRG